MSFQFESYVHEIVDRVSRDLGHTLDVMTARWINRPVGKELVKDASLAFYVDGKTRADDIVLLVANPAFPGVIHADVALARKVEALLTSDIARHISTPINMGTYHDQTYAVFARLSPVSDFRLVRLLQKHRAARKVLPWSVALAHQTRQPQQTSDAIERAFIHPLVALSNNDVVSDPVKDRAARCLDVVTQGTTELFTCVQHGDFWIGNVFFDRRPAQNINPGLGDFTVIDWRGARLDGYPCVDWMRFCASLFKPGSGHNGDLVAAYRTALNVSKMEFQIYCMSAFGRLGQELDQFPVERYTAGCDKALTFLDAHCPI